MGTKVNYTLVGLFVILLGAAIVWTALWLSAPTNKTQYHTYLVYMNETVSGLSEQAPVKFNGVTVGSVKSIRLNPMNPQDVILLLSIEAGTPISTSTTATLVSQGVTGISFVGLSASTPDAPLLEKKPGQQYPAIQSRPSLFVQVGTALQNVTDNLKKLSTSVQNIFDKENQAAFKASLQNIQNITKTLSDNSKALGTSIRNANIMLKNTAEASKRLPQTVQNFNVMLTKINGAADSLKAMGDKAQTVLGDSSVVLSNVNTQTLPSILLASNKLTEVLSELNILGNKLQRDPSILIRGIASSNQGGE